MSTGETTLLNADIPARGHFATYTWAASVSEHLHDCRCLCQPERVPTFTGAGPTVPGRYDRRADLSSLKRKQLSTVMRLRNIPLRCVTDAAHTVQTRIPTVPRCSAVNQPDMHLICHAGCKYATCNASDHLPALRVPWTSWSTWLAAHARRQQRSFCKSLEKANTVNKTRCINVLHATGRTIYSAATSQLLDSLCTLLSAQLAYKNAPRTHKFVGPTDSPASFSYVGCSDHGTTPGGNANVCEQAICWLGSLRYEQWMKMFPEAHISLNICLLNR
jgi:hypothetical protein